MSATDKDQLLALQLQRRGIPAGPTDARILRRASLTLHRWSELECGDSNAYTSWAIERDEETGIPYMVRHQYHHNGTGGATTTRTRIPDREKGALKRVAKLCQERGWYFFHQTDPRGCALYVSTEPLDQSNYTKGVGV